MGILLLGYPSSLPGEAGINLGQGDASACKVINIFKMAAVTYTDFSDAAKMDADGYLTSAPTGSVSLSWSSSAAGGAAWTGVNYVLSWPATIQFKIRFGSALTLVGSPTGATVVGGTGVGNTTITTTSGAGRIVFTNGATQPSALWMTDGTFSRSGGELAFYRESDEADFLAGQYWTPEFRAQLRELRPAYIRPMGWVHGGGNNYNGEVAWGDRIPLTQFSWNAQRILPTKWVGEVSGLNTCTCGSYTDMPGSYTDGEVFVGYISTANTSTTVTLDVGGRGAKTVQSRGAGALITSGFDTIALGASSTRFAIGLATFTYDGITDRLLYSPHAYHGSVPIEAQVQLANAARSPLWVVFPPMATDDYITNEATIVRNTLDAMAYFEYGNEIWNNSFPQTGWAAARGVAFGWTTSGNQHIYGWYGLRTREIMGDLIPAVYGGSLSSRVRRVMGYQGTALLSIQKAERLEGAMLNTTIANAAYDAYSGRNDGGVGQNYDTFPNRPVDVVESIAPAPYTGGTNLSQGADVAGTVPALGPGNLAFYQALVDYWVAGNTSAAFALIDADIRDGRAYVQTVTASGTTFTTPLAHGLTTSMDVYLDVTGGTAYSGVTTRVPYRVASVPTSTTLTLQPYVGGVNTGSAINAGSAGTGTMTIGQVGRPILYMVYTSAAWGETTCAAYDAQRAGGGLPSLRCDWYEGNLEPNGPTATQCTTIGITGHTAADAAAAVAAALLAWKNDLLAKATMKSYYEAMTGLDPDYPANTHTHHTSQLVLPGPGLYSMTSGPLPTDTPYQLYYGFKEFNEETTQ